MAVKAVERFSAFLRETREELARVSWPTREELIGSAIIVFVGVMILASYIAIVDFALSKTVRIVLQ